jgi:hypothetical protein
VILRLSGQCSRVGCEIIGEYCGRVSTLPEFNASLTPGHPSYIPGRDITYSAHIRAPDQLSDILVIDALHKGSKLRFANHSCQPNAELVILWRDRRPLLFLRALHVIYPGQEITFHYNWIFQQGSRQPHRCLCGFPSTPHYIEQGVPTTIRDHFHHTPPDAENNPATTRIKTTMKKGRGVEAGQRSSMGEERTQVATARAIAQRAEAKEKETRTKKARTAQRQQAKTRQKFNSSTIKTAMATDTAIPNPGKRKHQEHYGHSEDPGRQLDEHPHKVLAFINPRQRKANKTTISNTKGIDQEHREDEDIQEEEHPRKVLAFSNPRKRKASDTTNDQDQANLQGKITRFFTMASARPTLPPDHLEPPPPPTTPPDGLAEPTPDPTWPSNPCHDKGLDTLRQDRPP